MTDQSFKSSAGMRALQLGETGKFADVELPIPQLRLGELRIRTTVSTICTSDLGDIEANPFGIPLPRVLGHEAAGVIEAVASDVTGYAPGDRVACHPVISCHVCVECRRNMEHLCLQMGHLGHDRDGTYAEFFSIPAERVRRIPEHLDFACAALIEPVSVCLQAVNRARVAPGGTLLVAGDGPFGVMMARLAKKRGARVIVAGMQPFRLERTWADLSIRVDRERDPLSMIQEATEGRGVDSAILAVNAQQALDLCIDSLRPRGRLAVFAIMPDRPNVDMLRLLVKELELVGACNDENLIDEALEIIVKNEIALDEIVTHRVPFAEWPKAFELAARHPDEVLKVALIVDGSHSQ